MKKILLFIIYILLFNTYLQAYKEEVEITNPYISSVEKYKIDTINICDKDTIVSFNLEKIKNKGNADLIVYKSKITNKLNWETIVALNVPLDNNDYIIAPKDSFIISVQYKIPYDVTKGTYYDTINIWHNDTLRPNPLEIYVEIPLKKIEIKIKPDLTNLGKISNTDTVKDTIIALVNKNNVPISFTNISCNSNIMDYSFNPSSGTIPPKDSVIIIVSYAPKSNTLKGEFQDEILIILNCAISNKSMIIGTTEDSDTKIISKSQNLGKITKCEGITYTDSLLNRTNKAFTVNKIELYGTDDTLFSYSVASQLPIVLKSGEYIRFTLTVNDKGADLGVKQANLDFHTLGNDGISHIYRYEFMFEVVEPLVATPQHLNLENIVNLVITEDIKIEYQASYPANIGQSYLKYGNIFKLNTDLTNRQFNKEKDFVIANISCQHNAAGDFYDTLVMVLLNKHCNDSLFIPLSVRMLDNRDTNLVHISLPKITLCDFVSSGFNIAYVSPKDKCIIDSIKGVYGVDKDLFTYTKSHNLPCNLEENDTFKLNLKVQSSLLTSIGNKTAFLELYTTENSKTKIYILNLESEIVPGVIVFPSFIDFGTVQDNEQLTKKIDIINQDTINKLMRTKIKDVKLKHNENFVLSKTISAGISIQKDSILVSLEPTKYGVLEDTVIIVIAYPLCEDTFRIPLKVVVQSVPTEKNKLQIIASKHKLVSPSSLNYKIPIYITSSANLTNFKIDTLVLNLNKTLYHLLSVDKGVFSAKYIDSNCEISISDILVPSAKPNVQEVLLTLSGNVLLGNTDSTAITVSRCIINNSIFNEFDPQHGYLTLSICESGNDRLLRQSNYVPNVTVIENPVNSALLTLECIVIESGNYSLEIIDVLGNVHILKEWNVNVNDGNQFRFSIPTDNYGNGNYIVVMTTPSAKYNTRFLILKY